MYHWVLISKNPCLTAYFGSLASRKPILQDAEVGQPAKPALEVRRFGRRAAPRDSIEWRSTRLAGSGGGSIAPRRAAPLRGCVRRAPQGTPVLSTYEMILALARTRTQVDTEQRLARARGPRVG